ncbi:YcaO-like family protein [Sorangium cellulosum]|uniref:YcaO-like family protein n=1 Tax=Sorangium cellulosum TaxID=56 RepID=UPI003D9A1EAD
MPYHTLERSATTAEAIGRVQQEISRLGLRPRVTWYGDALRTYECSLRDDEGREVAVGNGKGTGEQSLASALFEAVEHYFTDPHRIAGPCEPVAVAELSACPQLASERVFEELARTQPGARLPCRTYTTRRGDDALRYPLVLSMPDYIDARFAGDTFDYALLIKYATNNGTAIGLTQEEALIHGVCELLERDAVSTFLLETFVAPAGAPLRIIARRSLPGGLRELLAASEALIGRPITLLDIRNDFGLPACLALAAGSGQDVPLAGSGASLSWPYAIERAVLETVQLWHLCDAATAAEHRAIVRRFAGLPRYQRCVELDIGAHLAEGNLRDVAVAELPEEPVRHGDLGGYLDRLEAIVAARGHRIYFAQNRVTEGGIACVHCLIPGLERFHLVRSGQAVLPSRRGLGLIGRALLDEVDGTGGAE